MSAIRIELSLVPTDKPTPLEQLTPLIPHIVEVLRLWSSMTSRSSADTAERGTSTADFFSFGSGPSAATAESAAPDTDSDSSLDFDDMSGGDIDDLLARMDDNLIAHVKRARLADPELFRRIQHAMMEPDEELGTDEDAGQDGERAE